LACPRTKYQRDRYPYLIGDYERVKKIGFEEFLKEERKKAEAGVPLRDLRKY
jgi:hypothetical protein